MAEKDLDIMAMLGLFRRRIWLIVSTFVIVVGLTGAVVVLVRPGFTASALILVDPSRKDLLDPRALPSISSSDSARVDSEVELVRSEATLLRVVRAFDLVNDPEFGASLGLRHTILGWVSGQAVAASPAQQLQATVHKLRQAISVQRRGLTFLILLQAQAEDPLKAARLANGLAQAYIDQQLEAKVEAALGARSAIQDRVAGASFALIVAEQELDAFVAQNVAQASEGETLSGIEGLRQALANAESEGQGLVSLLEAAERHSAGANWSAVAGALQSATLLELDGERRDLERQLSTLVQGAGEAGLQADLSAISAEMERTAQSELLLLRTRLAETETRAAQLREELRNIALDSDLSTSLLTRFYELQQTAVLARSQYETLLARLHDLDAQASLQVADSRVVSQATPPGYASFPNTRLFLALAGFGGLALGLTLALLHEKAIGSFTTEAQLASALNARVIASLPLHKDRHSRAMRQAPDRLADLVIHQSLSTYAEAVRRLKIGLERSLRRTALPRGASAGEALGSVVLVTSALPKEGRTLTALALARACAAAGRNTLLIDADLRAPGLCRYLGLSPPLGLLDYLQEETSLQLQALVVEDPRGGSLLALNARASEEATDRSAGSAGRPLPGSSPVRVHSLTSSSSTPRRLEARSTR